MSGQILEPTILQKLAAHLARPVDAASLDRARWHVLDWIGCAYAGRTEAAGQVLSDWYGPGSGAEVFFWGGLGNILEMDDVDKRALLHPGPSIVPAALICADVMGADGAALMRALVRGYDATIRLGRAVGAEHYAMWHSTGTCAPIGAAAACASLHGLSETQTAHAMALAISQAAGLWQMRHEPASMGKQLHTAHAARAGLEAAQLASAGFTGPLSILEGEHGFFAAMCEGALPGDVLADYGRDWLTHEVSFKPWPACRHAHAVIDAALELAEAGADLSGPIMVRTYDDALKFCDKPEPQTVIEAKFSLQHAVAVCLVRGAPSLEDFSVAATRDPELSAVRARVRVEVGAAYEAVYPARFGGEVSIGAQTVKMPDALGDPENPVSEAQLKDKAKMLMAAGGQSDDDMIAMIEGLQGLSSCGALVAKLRKALS